MRAILLVAAALLGVTVQGRVTVAADAATGEALARQWCIGCHALSSEFGGSDAAPSFSALVARTGADRGWVRRWLAAPHPPMPDPNLSRQEIEDLIAYLESRRPR